MILKKEQYEFCLAFYEICNRYLEDKDRITEEDEQKRIEFFKKLKMELEGLLDKGKIINDSNNIITNDFNYAYDLVMMLHTYINCIPENKTYLLMELFTFMKKYKTKVEDNNYLEVWENNMKLKDSASINNDYYLKKLKRKIIIILILAGAITTGAIVSQTDSFQNMINNFNDEETLILERKK